MLRQQSRHRSSLIALFAAFTLVASVQAHGNDPHARVASEKGWRTNLKSAKEEARKSGKPMMVVLRCFD
jgi:hypothetical protein